MEFNTFYAELLKNEFETYDGETPHDCCDLCDCDMMNFFISGISKGEDHADPYVKGYTQAFLDMINSDFCDREDTMRQLEMYMKYFDAIKDTTYLSLAQAFGEHY